MSGHGQELFLVLAITYSLVPCLTIERVPAERASHIGRAPGEPPGKQAKSQLDLAGPARAGGSALT